MVKNTRTEATLAARGLCLKLSELEIALLDDPSVRESVVLTREIENSRQELVVYFVPTGPFSLEQMHSRLQATLPKALLPSIYVPVSTLPYTPKGQLDEQALLCLEVIDADLVKRWEKKLRSITEIEQVVVVVQEQTEISRPPLHLSDLLLDWKAIIDENSKQVVLPTRHKAIKQDPGFTKRLAISYGEFLRQEAGRPKNLVEALQQAALKIPVKGVTYIQPDGSDIFQSYENLIEEAQCILAGLKNLGLKPKDKVIFQLELNQDFIPAFWGCVLGGFVPVPISIISNYKKVNSTVSKFQKAWQMLDKPIILTSAKLAPDVCSLSNMLNLENFQVATVDRLRAFEPDQNWHLSLPDELVILLLTSGSTGIPKLVMQSHRSLLNRSAATAQMNSFTFNDVSLNWLPLDHIGGLVMFHLRDVYIGCQQVHAPTDYFLQKPLKWLDWIEDYGATITWAPNFAYGLINSRVKELNQGNWDLSSMRFILNGGEAIVAKQARKFLELLAPYGLSATSMYPAWGMSETSSGVTYSHSFSINSTSDSDELPVDVGLPIPGFSVRIVGNKGQIVKEGIIGCVQVKGASVTSGYYQNPKANQEAFTDDGWFNTGDLGFLQQGHLTITGRQKDIIIINGLNYYSHEIESEVEELEGIEVSYVAAIAVSDSQCSTNKLAIFFSPVIFNELEIVKLCKEIRLKIVQNIGINPDFLIPIEKEAVPKTSIGKIQRSNLRKRFDEGEFNETLKQVDIYLKNNNTLPDWFYRKNWYRKELATLASLHQVGKTLVFLDKLGLGKFLCGDLERYNKPYVSVEAGSDFAQLGSNHYRITPGNQVHYQLLLESLATDKIPIRQILHLWTYNEYVQEISSLDTLEQAQEQGVYSLLFLVQALARVQGSKNRVRLLFIGTHTQCSSPSNEIAYENATVLGIIKTIPQELPWVDSCHIDLTVDQVEVNGNHIVQELSVLSGEQEVIYRDGQRFVARLEKVELPKLPKQQLPFKRGGIYLLSGGLGGIGVQIAKYLLKHYQARLLLIGRTPLPERKNWQTCVKQEDVISKRIQAYQELDQLEGEVIYEAVDVSNFVRLREVVEQAKSRWRGELDGVFNLAGVIQEKMLIELTKENLAEVLHSKVFGTWVLDQLLKDKVNSLFINFSSVNGFFGGTNVGAYAAANSFLDVFTYHQRYKNLLQSYCFAWSMWSETGMSRDYQMKELTRAKGYHTMNVSQGMYSFIAGLNHKQIHLLVGLAGENSHIRNYVESKSESLQKLFAYFTVRDNLMAPSQLHELVVQDRFGMISSCNFIQLQEWPLTETGFIDRVKLGASEHLNPPISTEWVAPRNEAECQIANIWQEVLDIPQVGIHENFFEIGGHSLLIVQVQSKLQEIFDQEISVVDLFRYPTIHSLVQYLSQAQGTEAYSQPTQDLAKMRHLRKTSVNQQRQLREKRSRD